MNRNIIVIGGSSGIGQACTERFITNNDHVFNLARSATSKEDKEGLTNIDYDISNDELNAEQLPEAIDSLIYCPGTINLKPFNLLTAKDFRNDFEINCVGFANTVRNLLPNLKNADSASVVTFSSVAVKEGMAYHASVAASKAAVEGLSRALSAEYSATGIRFNVVAPSMVDTPLAEKFLRTDEKKEAIKNRHPLKAIGEPSDIAEIVWFLTTDACSWMTGQVIRPDGGISSIYKS